MAYSVSIEHFEGPLDLLLQLVEKNELEISKISLAAVAEQFVQYMKSATVPPEEMADFLVVASRLVYIKSQQLLPGFTDQEMEEGQDLEAQLRQYQMFVNAARQIDKIWNAGRISFVRPFVLSRRRAAAFVPPTNVTADVLLEAMRRVIARIEPMLRLPQAAVSRAVSIHERLRDLLDRVKHHAALSFNSFVQSARHKEDAIVSFLALLELIKQQFVVVSQSDLFQDINIVMNPEAPVRDPLAESFA